MDTVSEKYTSCTVKLQTEVSGSDSESSGFLYATSPTFDYNYVFTAKHTFLEHEEDGDLSTDSIAFIEILCYIEGKFVRYERIPQSEIEDRVITFEEDFLILKVQKKSIYFPPIQVSDKGNQDCVAYSITQAFNKDLLPLILTRRIAKNRVYSLQDWDNAEKLKGCSGSGILSSNAPVLQGIIVGHPTKEFEGRYIQAAQISFESINNKLRNLQLEELSTSENNIRRRLVNNNRDFVDINEALINGVTLNLELAIKRIRYDQMDDWFHDPLNFVDVLNLDFVFEHFKDFFSGTSYKVQKAEIFYLPKKSFSLRKAMIQSFPDRIFYMALVETLGNSLDYSLNPRVYSARFNKFQDKGIIISGVEQWKKMQYQLQDYSSKYEYVIEVDILNFYDNIDINLLCDKILTVCSNKNERRATEQLRITLSEFAAGTTGIPQNSDASSLLASFYLNEIDAFMYHAVPMYTRFMDDIKIFCHNQYEARRYLQLFEMELRKLKLSLNSQKTEIINLRPRKKADKEEIKKKYQSFFDLKRSKLARLSNSNNSIHVNEAFHLAIDEILRNIDKDSIGSTSKERTLNQAMSVLHKCISKDVRIHGNSKVNDFLGKIPDLLKDLPWITPQICSLIGILEIESIPEKLWKGLIEIVLNEQFNTYSWQGYNLWLLLAKHKIKDENLSKFATSFLISNDNSNRPIIAGMMIYMGAVDTNYRRVILNRFKEGFTLGSFFQERAALIVLRSFDTSDVTTENSKSEAMHKSLNKFKEKDLVYIAGEKDKEEFNPEFLQLYSL